MLKLCMRENVHCSKMLLCFEFLCFAYKLEVYVLTLWNVIFSSTCRIDTSCLPLFLILVLNKRRFFELRIFLRITSYYDIG